MSEELELRGYRMNGIDLTQRQTQCLYYLIRGKTAKEIGKIINLSPRTIEDHIAGLRYKLNCNTIRELVGKAIECGFVNVQIDNIY